MVGKTLGPFEIVARIGRGGMGEVYRARDRRLGREVALKVLPESFAADPDRRDRWLREARAVAALNHENICTLHDIGHEDGISFLVLELVDGENLAQRLTRGPLPCEEALRLAAQTAAALEAAHRSGIVHRDLKPENIQVTTQDSVKLLDFGLAKLAEPLRPEEEPSQTPTELATAAHTVLGTAGYMSPEQARGLAVDRRADVWALGVVLYEMLTGHRAFDGETAADRFAALLTAPVPFDELPSSLPTSVRSLLFRMLERDLERRLDDLDEARRVLLAATAEARPGAARARAEPTAAPAVPSLLVLPFVNTSADADNEYFSDGLTEEVISDLSRVGSLRVISRTSAMRLKGTHLDVASLARQLGVDHVLEGSVRRAGSSFRITAQLVDARRDSLVWSDKYGGTVDDVFAIQERVSRAIVAALELRLTQAEDAALAAAPMGDPQAWDVYLRARHAINQFTSDSLRSAGDLLRQARGMAGPHPLLERGLGMLEWQYVNSGLDADPQRLVRAEEHALRGLALDPEGAHGPTVLGLVSQARGDLHGWVRHLHRAVEIDPGDADIRVWLGHAWNCAGRPERARPLFESLARTDPLFDFVHFGLGNLALFAGDPVTAEAHYRRSWSLTPDNPGWIMLLGNTIALGGEPERAVELIEAEAPPPESHPLAGVCHLEAAAFQGDASKVKELLTPALRASLWHDVQYPRFVAAACAVVGWVDEALLWAARCADNGFIAYPFYAEHDRLLDSLRSEPRFVDLLASIEDRWRRFPRETGLSEGGAR